MFKLLGGLVEATVRTALLPVAIVEDVLIPRSKSETVKQVKKIVETLEKTTEG